LDWEKQKERLGIGSWYWLIIPLILYLLYLKRKKRLPKNQDGDLGSNIRGYVLHFIIKQNILYKYQGFINSRKRLLIDWSQPKKKQWL